MLNLLPTIASVLRSKGLLPHVFPFVLTMLLILFTFMGISGSSVNVYDIISKQHDAPIIGSPQPVRSDEWLVNTPLIVSQAQSGFPKINTNLGDGRNMSIVVDVPYIDWSAVFKPQNFSFFIMPLENAFAFKWWFLSWMLMISVYMFFITLAPQRILLAVLLSIFMCFNPFIQWWYQSITILPVAYSFFALTLIYQLLRTDISKRVMYCYILLLAYVLCCFAFLMYPAFLIPCALFIIILSLTFLKIKRISLKETIEKRLLFRFVTVLVLALIPLAIFIAENFQDISAIMNTSYPGKRNVPSGGFDIAWLLSWPLGYLLLSGRYAATFNTNQSEMSLFLLLGLVLLPFICFAYARKRLMNRAEFWLMIASAVLILIVGLRLIAPFTSSAFALFGFNAIPHARFIIVLGLINCLLLYLAVVRPSKITQSLRRSYYILGIYAALFFILYTSMLLVVGQRYALDFIGPKEITLISGIFTIISVLIVAPWQRARLSGLGLLVLLSGVYSISINPLTRGLGDLTRSAPLDAIVSLEKKDNFYWIADNSPSLSALLFAAGAETQGGVMAYPNSDAIEETFYNQRDIVNRYSHARITVDNSIAKPEIKLLQADSYLISTGSCQPLLEQLRVKYIISERDYSLDCFNKYQSVSWGQIQLYIYKRKSLSP